MSSRLWIGRAHDVFEFTTFKRVRNMDCLPKQSKPSHTKPRFAAAGAVRGAETQLPRWHIKLPLEHLCRLVKYSVMYALHNFICASQASGVRFRSLNYEALRVAVERPALGAR